MGQPINIGNLYGETGGGGDLAAQNPVCYNGTQPSGCGVVFRLTPAKHGPWTESILHAFTGGTDGAGPESNLLFDSAGNLYGVTENGGNDSSCGGYGCGVVFELQ